MEAPEMPDSVSAATTISDRLAVAPSAASTDREYKEQMRKLQRGDN